MFVFSKKGSQIWKNMHALKFCSEFEKCSYFQKLFMFSKYEWNVRVLRPRTFQHKMFTEVSMAGKIRTTTKRPKYYAATSTEGTSSGTQPSMHSGMINLKIFCDFWHVPVRVHYQIVPSASRRFLPVYVLMFGL